MNKIRRLFYINKRGIICILVITIIGIIAGSLFFYLLNGSDKEMVISSIGDFFDNINNINYEMSIKSNLIFNFCLILVIWLLGISIIGIPIILIIYFLKSFSLGFILVSIISKYGFKGVIYAFIYLFPHNVINLLSFALLSIYGVICSFRMVSNFSKDKKIDLSPIFSRYRLVLIICIIISLLCSLYQTFIVPNILKVLLNILK